MTGLSCLHISARDIAVGNTKLLICRPLLGLNGTHLKSKYQGLIDSFYSILIGGILSLVLRSMQPTLCFHSHWLFLDAEKQRKLALVPPQCCIEFLRTMPRNSCVPALSFFSLIAKREFSKLSLTYSPEAPMDAALNTSNNAS